MTEHGWLCARRDHHGSFWVYQPSLRTDADQRARWVLCETTVIISSEGVACRLAGPDGEEFQDRAFDEDTDVVRPLEYTYLGSAEDNTAALLKDLDAIESWVYDADDTEATLVKFTEVISTRGWTPADGPNVEEESMWHYLGSVAGVTADQRAEFCVLPTTILADRDGFEIHFATAHGYRSPRSFIAPAGTAGLGHLHTILPKLEQHRIDPALFGST